ncbi:hypothetical protein RJ55_08556 [Drechmeria coniospora]|nr:hypothetical protein RJ55_08556 [Drechmeria coniospora]
MAMDPSPRFYQHFQASVAVLEDQIEQLTSASAVAGERQDAINHLLAGIAKLQNEVADAAETTPSYDRRQYSETIKGLQEKLNETVAKVNPRTRFQFKRSGAGTAHADTDGGVSSRIDPRLNPGSFAMSSAPAVPSTRSNDADNGGDDEVDTLGQLPAKPSSARDYNLEMSMPGVAGIRKPSFSTASNIGISNQSGLHIILPSSAARATASGSLTDLTGCIVDMSVPTATGQPFAGLALKNIRGSLIVAGRVNGPVHMTAIADSIVVVVARQVRIHECRNVHLYLHCSSHPIIEDCTGMRFAPLPAPYMTESEGNTENQWDQVDDFKWLKAGHSPNWTVLPDEEVLDADVWTKIVPGQPGASVQETLAKVGLPRG